MISVKNDGLTKRKLLFYVRFPGQPLAGVQRHSHVVGDR